MTQVVLQGSVLRYLVPVLVFGTRGNRGFSTLISATVVAVPVTYLCAFLRYHVLSAGYHRNYEIRSGLRLHRLRYEYRSSEN